MVWPRSSHAGRAAPKLTQGLGPQTWQKIQRETKKNLETNSNWWLQIRNRIIWCFPVPTMIWNRWRIIRNRCNLMARCNLWCCGQFKWNRYGHLKGPSKVKSKYTLNHLRWQISTIAIPTRWLNLITWHIPWLVWEGLVLKCGANQFEVICHVIGLLIWYNAIWPVGKYPSLVH